MRNLLALMLCTLFLACACTSLPTAEVQKKRVELNTMAEQAIDALKKKEPDLQDKLDKSLAYGVANMKVTKVPIVGAGRGEGVLLIKNPQERIYFKFSRFDVGGGWGARAYKALMIINDKKVLDAWKSGKWIYEAGAEAAAGAAAAQGSSGSGNKGFTIHILAEAGASATATARIIRIKVDRELTEEPSR